MARTYIPALAFAIRQVIRYARRHAKQLQEHTSSPQWTCITNLIVTLDDCLTTLGYPPA
jgi:hypothetical protein